MRCVTCNRGLSDYESTQRHAITMEYLDMCGKCLTGLGIPAIGNTSLSDMAPSDYDEVDIQDSQDWEELE